MKLMNFSNDIKILINCNFTTIFLLEMLKLFRSLLGRKDLPTNYLCYDTTFELGDFYLSVLTFRQTEFLEKPVIPVMYMIHERKWESFFFSQLAKLVPELSSESVRTNKVIATDEEAAIVNAIDKHLPGIAHFRCWIHAANKIKDNLRKLGVTIQTEKEKIKLDFLLLLKKFFFEEYKDALMVKMAEWPQVILLII